MAENTKKIAMGCDHAALDMKTMLAEKLSGMGYEIVDVGTHTKDSCDYPVYAKAVAKKVASGECACGILVCGSGIGMSMAANKVRGVRAVVCTEPFSAEMARRHNDSNVLCLGARLVGPDMAMEIVNRWMNAHFEGGRHQRRVDLMEKE